MQVFRLVNGGQVDSVIGINELPADLLKNVRMMEPNGFPRHWKTWLRDNGSVMPILEPYEEKTPDGKLIFRYRKIGETACFYVLEYRDINQDKERWQQIVQYLRRVVDPNFRLLDKIEDMAKPLAKDCYAPLELEPEDVTVIVTAREEIKSSTPEIEMLPDVKEEIPVVEEKKLGVKEAVELAKDGIIPIKRKRGRPKKEPVEL